LNPCCRRPYYSVAASILFGISLFQIL
jgi:hypothetical protein